MSYINPALFHVFGNTRILTAGVLYRIMMGRKQSDLQWLALLLLTAGAIMVTPLSESTPKEGEDNFLGLVIQASTQKSTTKKLKNLAFSIKTVFFTFTVLLLT
jgi:hypothetical protein